MAIIVDSSPLRDKTDSDGGLLTDCDGLSVVMVGQGWIRVLLLGWVFLLDVTL